MTSDTHNQHNEEPSSQTTYPSEYTEDVQNPGRNLSYPVIGPEEFIKVGQSEIDGAVMLVPNHIVEAVIRNIWSSTIEPAQTPLDEIYHQEE